MKDTDNWVRLNAALALARFGNKARPTCPCCVSLLKTEDDPLKEQVQKSIQAIEQAADKPLDQPK